MPPVCCRCNGSGSCKNCSCRKANSSCSNCLPLRRGHCTNTDQQLPRPSTDNAPASRQTLPSSLHTPDNEGIEPPAIAPPETGEAPQRAEAGPSLTTDSAAKNVTPSNVTPSLSATANDSTIADLPQFTPLSTPNFRWADMDGEAFSHSVDRGYEEIVHWRRNLFKVPSGKRQAKRLFERWFCP